MAYPPGVYQLSIVASVANQFVENVLHFWTSSSVASPLQQSQYLIDAWKSTAETAWLACLPSDYLIGGYRAKLVGSPGSATYVDPGSGTQVGTRPNPSELSGVGPVLSFPVNNSGDPVRKWDTAKIFMPGVAFGDCLGNRLTDGMLTPLTALIDVLLDPITDTGVSFAYCNASFSAGTYQIPTGGYVALLLGTQRRRYKPAL